MADLVTEDVERPIPCCQSLEIDASAVSRDQAVVDDYVADPLVHHENIPARTVVSLFDEASAVLGRAVKFLCQRYCYTVRKMY